MEKNIKNEAEDKINFIYQVINQISNAERKSGFHYIVWGTAIALAMMVHYLLLVSLKSHIATYSWIAITAIATVLSLIYFLNERRNLQTESNEKRITQTISVVFHFFLFLLLIVIQQTGIPAVPIIFMVYGTWLLITGSIIKFRPFTWGGILNWVMALSAIYIPLPYQLLLGTLVCLLSYALPGYLLIRRTTANA
ncbi:hypothetical protein [Chryseobacterium sp. BIGb0232]|uniref:hypothetical protein n=1 Tax=Chryseobacterium sp. BIGb0232 TaxID=2940598 RepID=UPI000F49ACB8|nr:hypothetical protein [Chryseobacterium sp. BIGb0232]MCS4301181.1 heme/copper-type cytochrome/quinol oxidase subunit 4 [Chryseobacterium sp. BIGb0232]ROS19958.1 hypothetical protein EDF65_0658 [Chryseobacterium nakagawai]